MKYTSAVFRSACDHADTVFNDVCGHRIIVSPKAKIAERKAEDILAEILRTEPVPQIRQENATGAEGKKR